MQMAGSCEGSRHRSSEVVMMLMIWAVHQNTKPETRKKKKVKLLVAQSCLTLCNHKLAHQAHLSMEFPQARILEGVAIFFSRRSSWPRDRTWVSCIAGKFCTAVLPGKPIYIYVLISILIQILSPYRLLEDIELSSLCYTVGLCWLPVLYIVVCISHCFSEVLLATSMTHKCH